MKCDRAGRKVQHISNLLHREAFGQELKNVTLTTGESTTFNPEVILTANWRLRAPSDRCVHCFTQFPQTDRFGKECASASLHGFRFDRGITIHAQIDDLHVRHRVMDPLSSIESVQAGHGNVHEHDVRMKSFGGLDQLATIADNGDDVEIWR
jgi:hypothetical protein